MTTATLTQPGTLSGNRPAAHADRDRIVLAQARAATPDFQQPIVTIEDRHMGSGKTTRLMKAFKRDKKYLVIVPLLSEVERIIKGADVLFYQPLSSSDTAADRSTGNPFSTVYPTKRESMRALLEEGHNVVSSHALFSEIGGLAKEGLLADYHVLIDEVLTVAEVKTSITQTRKTGLGRGYDTGWRELYLDNGYVNIDVTGQIRPTEKWHAEVDKLAGNLSREMYLAAEAGRLYTEQAGLGRDIIMWELPVALLKNCKSLRVHTYMSEGSFMLAYMRKHGIEPVVEFDAVRDAEFRARARELVTVDPMPRLARTKFTFNAQSKAARSRKPDRNVGQALCRMKRTPGELKGVDPDKIMLTCAKDCWYENGGSSKAKPGVYARESRLFDGVHWVPNTTRGTNDYSHCSHLIYLWDQHANPNVSRFLDVDDQHHKDLHAISELLQWVWRSRVRRDEPVTLYLPSERMRHLWARWLNGEL